MIVHHEAAHSAEEPAEGQRPDDDVVHCDERHAAADLPDDRAERGAREAAVRGEARPELERVGEADAVLGVLPEGAVRDLADVLRDLRGVIRDGVEHVPRDEAADEDVRDEIGVDERVEPDLLRAALAELVAEHHARRDEEAEGLDRQRVTARQRDVPGLGAKPRKEEEGAHGGRT